MTPRYLRFVLTAIAVLPFAGAAHAADIGTAFTYQGQLKQDGAPANGNLDMEFRLFDASTLGNQVGNPVTLNGVPVSNGLFTVTLNAAGEFGPSAFNGEQRWLQVTVNGTRLAPRQPITPVPYASHALNAPDGHSLDASDGSPVDAVFVDEAGHVGIGTQAPVAGLHVEGPGYPSSFLFLNSTGGNNDSGLRLMRDGDVYWHVFNRESTGDSFSLHNALFGPVLVATQDGRVGIGTTTPATELEVNGAARTTTLEITGGSPLQQPLSGWGLNDFGQTDVPAGSFVAVAAGAYHSLAIRTDGTLVGWGFNGDGQTTVPSGTFTAVSGGGFYSLAIRSDGTLVGWGDNSADQTTVPAGTFTAVAAGYLHSLAIRSDGTLSGWGYDGEGLTNVPSGTFTAVSAGTGHGLAIRSDGTLVGWGYNGNGETDVPEGTLTAVAAGELYSLAIARDPTPPALRLHSDTAYKPGSNTWTIFSDRRLKKNIEPLSGALENLLQLHGVTFQWIDPASQGGITGTQMGLIADEVSRAFPQWVGRDPKGYQTLTVGGFEALTAEALRELRSEKDAAIGKLQEENTELREMLKRVSERIVALEGGR